MLTVKTENVSVESLVLEIRKGEKGHCSWELCVGAADDNDVIRRATIVASGPEGDEEIYGRLTKLLNDIFGTVLVWEKP